MSTTPVCEQHKGPVLSSANGYDIIDCEACGFAHITPLPTIEQLEKIYAEEFYATTEPVYIDRYKEDRPWWDLVYNDRYDSFEQMVPAGSRRLLDIGSGPGLFLLRGKERGWDVLGIEPSRQACEYSRSLGLEVLSEFFDRDLAPKLGRFDVIHLSLVLEHLPDPAETLRLCQSLLAPHGILCVTVPNEYNPFQTLAYQQLQPPTPWWLCPPHHINYFNSKSLENVMKRSGFDVVLGESTFPVEMFLLMGDNYAGNDQVGRSIHRKRMLFETGLATAGLSHIKRSLYQHMHTLGVGRESTVYGRPCPSPTA